MSIPNPLDITEYFREHYQECCTDSLNHFNQLETAKSTCTFVELSTLCEIADWDHYLEFYKDVLTRGIDPIIHFFKFGLYENRKIYAKIFFSIFMYIDNEYDFIKGSINSVLNQEFKFIELVIFIKKYLVNKIDRNYGSLYDDPRVKIVVIDNESSIMNNIRTGLEQARGRYIMWLRPGDILAPFACMRAYRDLKNDAANEKNLAIFKCSPMRGRKNVELDGYFTSLQSEDPGKIPDLFNLYIVHRPNICADVLCNKVISKTSILSLLTGYNFTNDSILINFSLCFLLLDSLICVYTIDQELYLYNDSDKKDGSYFYKRYFICLKLLYKLSLLKSIPAMAMNMQFLNFNINQLIKLCIECWFSTTCVAHITRLMTNTIRSIGLLNIISFLINEYGNQKIKLANLLFKYNSGIPRRSVRTIGIVYQKINFGGTESVLLQQIDLLIEQGYNVLVFLAESSDRDVNINKSAVIIYTSFYYNNEHLLDYYRKMYFYLNMHKIDLMIYHDCWNCNLIYDLLMMKYLNISVIMIHHSAFFLPLLYPDDQYSFKTRIGVFRCFDKLISLSRECEIFFRANGCNCQFMPNPVRPQFVYERPANARAIVFVGRLSDKLKQLSDALIIFSKVRASFAKLHMILVGDFYKDADREHFLGELREAGLEEYIHITGWTEHPLHYMQRACLLLSTSYIEGFSMSWAEAQSLGLPIVAYDVPSAMREDNDSIISVPQGDMKAAAKKIIELLNDSNRLAELRKKAIESAARFSPQAHIHQLVDIINSLHNYSLISPPDNNINLRALRYLQYYAERFPPWTGDS